MMAAPAVTQKVATDASAAAVWQQSLFPGRAGKHNAGAVFDSSLTKASLRLLTMPLRWKLLVSALAVPLAARMVIDMLRGLLYRGFEDAQKA